MSKRKRNKGRTYTISQFIEIVCKKCKHCEKQGLKDVKASFCYPIFKSNPWGFCEKTIPRIKQIEKCVLAFENIFCKECALWYDYGLDHTTQACLNFSTCINAFKIQTGLIAIKGNDLKINTFVNIKKSIKKTKKKEPYRVAVAYPTLFHGSTDPAWAKFIKDAVEDAYNDTSNSIEQDPNTTASRNT